MITLVALVVGVPLGIAAARFVWDAIAGSMGLATDIDVPIATLVIGAVVTVVVLNLISAISARFAGRLGVAEALRVE